MVSCRTSRTMRRGFKGLGFRVQGSGMAPYRASGLIVGLRHGVCIVSVQGLGVRGFVEER